MVGLCVMGRIMLVMGVFVRSIVINNADMLGCLYVGLWYWRKEINFIHVIIKMLIKVIMLIVNLVVKME
ncbi:MAG: hypothetical protein EZS28_015239 [Streblomastix strix]|uniref:Uncharacterized protein n=1 Tax=Streblomastix strix TaxID=222440 RepID=A0A5J4W2S6_9EUKA|nr:MAG: hypothetical protein EZS28_015239 [Streblomastix strix]